MKVENIITRRNYQSIVEQIVNMFVAGELKVGQQLPPERQFAEMLHVSRATLREALCVLEVIGLIEIKPGSGTYIRDLNMLSFFRTIIPVLMASKKTEFELGRLRKILEAASLNMEFDRKTADASLLEGVLSVMRETVEKGDVIQALRVNMLFHKIIIGLCGNDLIKEISMMFDLMMEMKLTSLDAKQIRYKGDIERLYTYQSDLCTAIRDEDEIKAVQLLLDSLDYASQYEQVGNNAK